MQGAWVFHTAPGCYTTGASDLAVFGDFEIDGGLPSRDLRGQSSQTA